MEYTGSPQLPMGECNLQQFIQMVSWPLGPPGVQMVIWSP
jgi:hypothetical protein